jgi:hypothetical protein
LVDRLTICASATEAGDFFLARYALTFTLSVSVINHVLKVSDDTRPESLVWCHYLDHRMAATPNALLIDTALTHWNSARKWQLNSCLVWTVTLIPHGISPPRLVKYVSPDNDRKVSATLFRRRHDNGRRWQSSLSLTLID